MHCELCHSDLKAGDHEPWCSHGDPGERPPEALIWEKLEEIEAKIARLAAAQGLPPDWDDE